MSSANRRRKAPRPQRKRTADRPRSAVGPIKNWWQTKSPMFAFSAKFCALLALSYAMLAAPVCRDLLGALAAGYAAVSNVILNHLGETTRLNGTTISSARCAITVIPACAGIELTQFFCAMVLAFPSRPGWKLLGIAAGVSLLPALNLLRITSLYLIGAHFPGAFAAVHERIWGTILVGSTLALSFLWIQWAMPLPGVKTDAVAA